MPMNNQIFVSHSQYDKDMITSFDRVFARTGVRSVCMEFEQMSAPEWKEIKEAVQNSLATFVLLGPNINRNIYTQNWVAFEVGLACATKKRVWVFQQNGSSVTFPIPYATDYMLYGNLEKKEVFDYVRKIIEGIAEEELYFSQVDKKRKQVPTGTAIQCPKCKGSFNYHCIDNSLSTIIKLTTPIPSNCPLCCQQIK